MLNKVMFVDVDGPLINTNMFILGHDASMNRAWFNTMSLAYVKRIYEETGALVVMNSTHNTHDIGQRTVKYDLLQWGWPEQMFHADWHTMYPFPTGTRFSDYSANRRQMAIDEWLEKNGEHDWIAFDDEPFTKDPRLIHIDFDRGIDLQSYRDGLTRFGYNPDNVKHRILI